VGPADVHNREQKFQQAMRKVTMDRLARPMNYARWSFDEGQGSEAVVKAPGQGALNMKLGPAATWTSGQFGTAVEFNGSFAGRAQLNPPLRRGIRTLACWARVPADGGNFDGTTLAAFGSQRVWGGLLELGWNNSPGNGVVGALQFQAPVGRLVGSTSVRDGRWHHVAVVLGAPGKAGRPPLKLYVDGRLEPFSGRSPSRKSVDAAEEPLLWVGGSPRTSESFRGMIDELVVADQPLTPQEIRHLIRSNALLSPEAVAGL
jgi:hypothetical protein